ncbi:MAG: DsrE family protein [Burkholderiaceae bacterium]|nr:DsrE family protein [Burkholderiaceae bacterium]
MKIRTLLAALVLAIAAAGVRAQETVVYHIADSETQALAGLRSLRNHLDTDPKARITVVAIAQGVDFLMEGAKDASGNLYVGLISALASRGVKFEVCEITLANRNLKRDQFIQEADFTPSGVVQLSRLQHQGYAYIKP